MIMANDHKYIISRDSAHNSTGLLHNQYPNNLEQHISVLIHPPGISNNTAKHHHSST